MPLLVKPNIVIDNIVIEKDPNDDYGTERILNEFGRNIPIVKIGEYVLAIGDLEEFNLNIGINSIPTFEMTINDSQYLIRENLKQDIDKCVIFIGYKDWYIKFNGIINKNYSEVGDSFISLFGELYNEKLYETVQKSYKNKTIETILKEIANETKMGLFTIDDEYLSHEIDYLINTGSSYFDFMKFLITRYTKNLYSIDPFYHIHVCNIDTVRNQPFDKYVLDWKTGKTIPESNIIFKSIKRSHENDAEDFKIPVAFYTIDTNFTEVHKKTNKNYFLTLSGFEEKNLLLKSNGLLGIGENAENSFSGFEKHKFPFYNEIVNKKIGGNLIKIKTDTVLFELSPFSVVGFECYLPFTPGREMILDEEHSGKKIVINFSIDFYKNTDGAKNSMTQTIEMI
jgi:hypothetical protein